MPKTDSQVLESVQAACLAGNSGMQTLVDLLPAIGRMAKPAIAIAKRMIYGRFDAAHVPRRLFNAAIKSEREAFLQKGRDTVRAKDFALKSASRGPSSIERRKKDPHAVALGRRGGLVRGKKGLAAMPAERAAAIRLLGVEAVKRKRAHQGAA
jgi:hypothetical protein